MSAPAPADPAGAPHEGGEQAPAKKFSLGSKKVKIAALLLVVMGVQTAVVYLVLPRPTSGAQEEEGDEHAAHGGDSHGHGDSHGGHGKGGAAGEVFIADFSSSVTASGGTIMFVTFTLHAVISSSSKDEFSTLVSDTYKARVQQSVVKVIRMSSMDELNDPNLDVLKRNLKTEINNVLPQRFVNEVIISEFRTMEQ